MNDFHESEEEREERLQIESCFSQKIAAGNDEEENKDGQKDFSASRFEFIVQTPKFSSKFDLPNYEKFNIAPPDQSHEIHVATPMVPAFDQSPIKNNHHLAEINHVVNDDAKKIEAEKGQEFTKSSLIVDQHLKKQMEQNDDEKKKQNDVELLEVNRVLLVEGENNLRENVEEVKSAPIVIQGHFVDHISQQSIRSFNHISELSNESDSWDRLSVAA